MNATSQQRFADLIWCELQIKYKSNEDMTIMVLIAI